jgi:hypothetical protein
VLAFWLEQEKTTGQFTKNHQFQTTGKEGKSEPVSVGLDSLKSLQKKTTKSLYF